MESFLKDAIEKIVSLAPVQKFEIGGQTYTSAMVRRVAPWVDRPESIRVTGLDSLVKLIKAEQPHVGTRVFVRVVDATTVRVYTTLLDDMSRNVLYDCNCDVPGFREGFRNQEQAIIELRSKFMPTAGSSYLLDMVSHMSDDSKVQSDDNGVTQTVVAKQGVSLLTNVEVKPIVALQPFRTFLEVAQPESEFLLRINKDGQVGLFEADGGVWELEAKRNIVAWLSAQLAEEISAEAVTVMM